MNPETFPQPSPPRPTGSAKRRGLLSLIFMAALGAAFGAGIIVGGRNWFAGESVTGLNARLSKDIWTAALLPVVIWACILVHEFGHIVGGWLGGMRPLMLFAGPLHLEFNADRVRFLLNRVAATWGGLAVCAPRSEAGATRQAFAMLVSGGPFASFLLAAITGPAALAVGGWWGGLLFVIAALSTVIGIATLIPLRSGGFMSDGGQLLGLARGDKVTQQRLALGALLGQSYAGVRPRDWDVGLLNVISEDSGDSALRVSSAMLAASRAEDCGDLATADLNWRRVAGVLNSEQGATIAAAARGAFALGLAGWIGHRRREAATARCWLDAAKGGLSEPASRAYAESAVALAEGDRETARRQLELARAALPRLSDRGGAIVLAEALNDIARELGESSG